LGARRGVSQALLKQKSKKQKRKKEKKKLWLNYLYAITFNKEKIQ